MSNSILFIDDINTGKEIDHDKLMELFSKAPQRQPYEKIIILSGQTYSIDETKRIMPQK